MNMTIKPVVPLCSTTRPEAITATPSMVSLVRYDQIVLMLRFLKLLRLLFAAYAASAVNAASAAAAVAAHMGLAFVCAGVYQGRGG